MRIAVVGGGITGLAAAYGLVQAKELRGAEVTLYEQAPRLGGKILTERLDGFLLEAGPDSFLTSKPEAVALSRALGLGEELVGTGPDRTVYVLSRGRLHPLPEGLALVAPTRVLPFMRSGLFTLPEKARIGAELLLPPRRVDSDESLGAFVRRRLGQAALDRIAAPLLAGIYAGDAEQLSLEATFPLLRELERRHGSVIAGMLARRRTAADADGHLPLFVTLRGGLGRLVERLGAALEGVEVRTGVGVEAIAREGAGYLLELSVGGRARADLVILTTPAFVAASLLEPLSPEAASMLRQIPYASTATVSLAFREGDLPPLRGHGFVVARGEGWRITACTWASAKWPDRAPPGFALLRAYVGSASDAAVLERSDEEILRVVSEELHSAMGITAWPVLWRIVRWPASMPQYTVGHLERLAAAEAALAGLPGLFLAGAGYRGIGLPDCIRQGLTAAAAVHARIGGSRAGSGSQALGGGLAAD
ncbi:MAG: protoporphyrinogen oxidase [Armatimonadota bacterium]|nr:protoporphyrinogen oxidase [Armatimonadota bacterium]MDR7427337.1 protoporphyrinogen oxidase [Armatimonadota bacterium]MDR7465368.1 protoporphyrinogen oxidase [Armatimonadota bacterium]MDR7468683.1 protoporphyrinogen oxidase [Armatimonadota bacterium]MDR7473806.1 protoporphyrinogen oxidase [Armatimonadota bacterium]